MTTSIDTIITQAKERIRELSSSGISEEEAFSVIDSLKDSLTAEELVELNKCPFCGSDAYYNNTIIEERTPYGEAHRKIWWVKCKNKNCEVSPETKVFSLPQYAAEAWNRRVDEE